MRISDWSSDCGSSDLVFEVGETHLAGVAAEHFGGQPVELDAVAARGGADDRGEQRLVEADARAAGRGDGEGFGPDMADRLDHQAIAARREDIAPAPFEFRSEEHTSELQSLMRIPYAVFCLKKKNK